MIDKLQVTIREASRDDLPRLVELMKSLVITTSNIESQGASTLAEYEPVFDEILRAPRHWIYVAEVEGQVVGSADFLIVPNLSHRGTPWAVIENVIVEESMRRKGVAGELMNHLIDLARQNQCYKLSLSSNKRRSDAHQFYKSLGFEQYGYTFRMSF